MKTPQIHPMFDLPELEATLSEKLENRLTDTLKSQVFDVLGLAESTLNERQWKAVSDKVDVVSFVHEAEQLLLLQIRIQVTPEEAADASSHMIYQMIEKDWDRFPFSFSFIGTDLSRLPGHSDRAQPEARATPQQSLEDELAQLAKQHGWSGPEQSTLMTFFESKLQSAGPEAAPAYVVQDEQVDVVALSAKQLSCGCIQCGRDRKELSQGWPVEMTRMTLCPQCGNKRCPHAANHLFLCTGSNAVGQVGVLADSTAPM